MEAKCPKWLHKRIIIHNEDVDKTLDEMGERGWQLVAVTEDNLETYKQLYFKIQPKHMVGYYMRLSKQQRWKRQEKISRRRAERNK